MVSQRNISQENIPREILLTFLFFIVQSPLSIVQAILFQMVYNSSIMKKGNILIFDIVSIGIYLHLLTYLGSACVDRFQWCRQVVGTGTEYTRENSLHTAQHLVFSVVFPASEVLLSNCLGYTVCKSHSAFQFCLMIIFCVTGYFCHYLSHFTDVSQNILKTQTEPVH